MSFANYAAIQSAVAAGKILRVEWRRTPTVAHVGTAWYSHWNSTGYPGGALTSASTPGTVYDQDANALTFPATSTSKWLINAEILFTNTVVADFVLVIYDRLAAVGSVSCSTTGNKTISSGALTRYTSGEGVELWAETTTGGTAFTIDVNSYTNQAGTTGRAGGSLAFPGNVAIAAKLPLQLSDSGVRAVSTINVSSASSAAVISVVLVRPLLYMQIPTGSVGSYDLVLQHAALQRIYDGASLGLLSKTTASVTPIFTGRFTSIYE